MRKNVPHNIFPNIKKLTGISESLLSDYVCTRKRPGGKRAIALASACETLGYNVPVELWLVGTSDKIKKQFLERAF